MSRIRRSCTITKHPHSPLWLTRGGRVFIEATVWHALGYRVTRGDRRVAPLMLETFKGPRHSRIARHLNDVRDDDRLSNLAWGDDAQNAADRVRNKKT
jgi:hypothetical protein